MKPLNLKEIALKEEMKERCLAKGQYIDENAKSKFEMLCHLEDFEVQYWELQKENKQLKEDYNKIQKEYESTFSDYQKLKDNWNKLREFILEEGFEINTREYGSLNVIDKNVILEKMQELEQGSNSNVKD